TNCSADAFPVTYASATAIFVSRLNLNLLTEKLPSLLQWFFSLSTLRGAYHFPKAAFFITLL
ncbi:MAG: hypothetical protein FWE05_02685, partial [Defluviitaleaceae bacterium]|nr:hypothetical protein [Defluviitaleaceae bacterium]